MVVLVQRLEHCLDSIVTALSLGEQFPSMA